MVIYVALKVSLKTVLLKVSGCVRTIKVASPSVTCLNRFDLLVENEKPVGRSDSVRIRRNQLKNFSTLAIICIRKEAINFRESFSKEFNNQLSEINSINY